MDKAEDQRRYFIFSSAMSEVVAPILRQKLSDYYTGLGCADFQAFLEHRPVRHILFHLRFNNHHCCTDRGQCNNHHKLPLVYNQWNLLYTTITGPNCGNPCHCKYTANGVDLGAIDLTLASLILIKLCILPQTEEQAVKDIRNFRNNHLSHNVDGCIQEDQFDALWENLMKNVLVLDSDKTDDLIRIHYRPMDARLYEKYRVDMMEIHKKILEMDENIGQQLQVIQNNLKMLVQEQTNDRTSTAVINRTNRQPYRLGQDIFCPLFTEINPWSLPDVRIRGGFIDALITDDNRIVMCLGDMKSLLICNSDGSSAYTILLRGTPWRITTIAGSQVAVTFPLYHKVVVYDINSREKIRTIPVSGQCLGISAIDNILAVGCNKKILIVDVQTERMFNTIHNNFKNYRLHSSGDKFFACHNLRYLTCYSKYGTELYTSTLLPSGIRNVTALQDESLYVTCLNNNVYHVSANGQSYKRVQNVNLNTGWLIRYNKISQKLLLRESRSGMIKIFHQF